MPGPDFNYIPPSEVIPIDGRTIHQMGMAVFLWLFLRSYQTAASGVVFWERPIDIDWIFARIPNSPPKSTLRLWMASLRANGYINCVETPLGMKITVVDPRDWPSLRSKKLISIDEIRLTEPELRER